LWKTEMPQNYLDIYGEGTRVYRDKVYSVGYSGTVYCWDTDTGKLDWSYAVEDPYTEILWSNNWPMSIYFTSDGKLYLFHTEHSANQPLPRGAPAICLNATTGEVIWRVDGLLRTTTWGGRPVMGDSVIAMYNTYDQLVYAIGKGPSATTVAASPKVSTYGSSVVVEGMVTDVSPGAKSDGLEMRFPNGVPAVSDGSMGEWMKYVYAQFPRPTDVTGVEVVLEVLDPNNNYYEVGRATSDASGMFHCAFTPEVPGEYTIVASFAGSKGYFGSFAETAINVEEAPAATPEPTPMPASAADLYLVPGITGIIVAIAVVGAIIVLMLRKR
jgi:outer membrane protein assembly factor BamB